jgi:hypothetical protein
VDLVLSIQCVLTSLPQVVLFQFNFLISNAKPAKSFEMVCTPTADLT